MLVQSISGRREKFLPANLTRKERREKARPRIPYAVYGLGWALVIAASLWKLRINEFNDDFLISPDEDLLPGHVL